MAELSRYDREQFLAEPHIPALSVMAGFGRGPFTLPIWYQYRPGGEAWILTEAESKKARLIQEAGRFSLMVNRIMPTNRYVSVEGPVSRIIPQTPELLLELTKRYLPDEQVQGYLDLAATFGAPDRDLPASAAVAYRRTRTRVSPDGRSAQRDLSTAAASPGERLLSDPTRERARDRSGDQAGASVKPHERPLHHR